MGHVREHVLLATVPKEDGSSCPLPNLLLLLNKLLLKEGKPANHGTSVSQVSVAEVLKLGLILQTLSVLDGTLNRLDERLGVS